MIFNSVVKRQIWAALGLLVSILGCTENTIDVETSQLRFEKVINKVVDGDANNLHSLLVWQDGKRVFELYRQGSGQDGMRITSRVPVGINEVHNLHSVTKSFVATLVFIAIDEGKIGSLNDSVFGYFPDYQQPDRVAKEKITIKNMLDMSTGYALNELSVPYTSYANPNRRHVNAKDLRKVFLNERLAFEPGSKFVYSGMSTVGLSKVIEAVYDMPFAKVMKEKLFNPLGITDYQWIPQYGSGEPGADWGLRLSSRDMEKFGRMWLNKGMFNDQQIVAKHWLREVRKSEFPGYKTSYGMHFWHLNEASNALAAFGHGEQYIVVLPQKNAVIVTTAGNYHIQGQPTLELVTEIANNL
ncbi:serine hydrolase domain-containing protein [Vibrio sp. DNB22_10_4]